MNKFEIRRCPICESLRWSDEVLICTCGYSVDDSSIFETTTARSILTSINQPVIKIDNPDFILNKIYKIKKELGYHLTVNTLSWLLEKYSEAEIESVNIKGNGIQRRIYPAIIVRTEPKKQHSSYHETVSIGIMCRCSDAEAIAKIITASQATVKSYIIVVDAQSNDSFNSFSSHLERFSETLSMQLIDNKFSGDFSKQRNIIQQNAKTEWVLQLDSDELISTSDLMSLGRVIHTANILGAKSVGLPRANIVDGIKSALYPDFQFRLNKREVHYKNIVHEEPNIFWRSKCVTSLLEIQHSLDSDRLPGRSKIYEAMAEGAGRDIDRALLMTSYEADCAYY